MNADPFRPLWGLTSGCSAAAEPQPISNLVIAAGAGVALLALPGAYPGWQPLPLLVAATLGIGALIAGRMQGWGAGSTAVRRLRCLLGWVMLGYLFGHWQIGMALEDRLPMCADSTLRTFEVHILDHPVLDDPEAGSPRVARFRGQVQLAAADDCPLAGRHHIRLAWYDPPPLNRGERWWVEGRLRPPWGNVNPGGFDYERWLLGQSLAGTGYIRSGERLHTLVVQPTLRQRIRARLADWVQDNGPQHAGIIVALMTGDDSALSQTQWRLLRDSGTIHLLVVSGLHVGMVSGFCFIAGGVLARSSRSVLLLVGARRAAGVFALLGSAVYVWISGAGVPALRAWLMSAVVLAGLMSGRAMRGLKVVGLVMAVLLLCQPLVVHQQGFWLSFVAVLALVGFFGPTKNERIAGPEGVLRRLILAVQAFLLVQLVLLFAMSPLLSAFQGGIPLQSPLINALVVPLVAFAALPLILLSALLLPVSPLAEWVLSLADKILGLVMTMVGTAASVPAVSMSLQGPLQWGLMVLLLLCLGSRPSFATGCLAVALWWALLLPDGRQPPLPGQFTVTALDVGQGSAILIDTHRHRLLYDTGPRYASGFDLGDAVVVPSFLQSRRKTLDALVLSHDDLDHTGGAQAVIRQLAPARIWTSFPFLVPGGIRSDCEAGVRWQWDEVTFRFLHPEPDWLGSDNDRSCVLLITGGAHSALLAGDVSRRAEARLAKRPVDLLMAPHHGSRTSSSPGFVRGFSPAVVFISTDRRSRYGHPHPDVLARYDGSMVRVTGRAGALRWSSQEPGRIDTWRQVRGGYWHGRTISSDSARCPVCE